MFELIKEAKQKYPKGTLFLSASGNLKSPLRVNGAIKLSENYPNSIIAESGGIICIINKSGQHTWAKIVK